MKTKGTRIFYKKSNKKILLEIGDWSGIDSGFTTIEEDIERLFSEIKEDVGCIEFEYGAFKTILKEHKANAYRLNDNNELEFYTIEYPPSPEELKEREIEELKDKVKQLENDKLELSKAAAELYEKSESDKLELSKAIAEIYEATVGAE